MRRWTYMKHLACNTAEDQRNRKRFKYEQSNVDDECGLGRKERVCESKAVCCGRRFGDSSLPEWDSRLICMWSPCIPQPVRRGSRDRSLWREKEIEIISGRMTSGWQWNRRDYLVIEQKTRCVTRWQASLTASDTTFLRFVGARSEADHSELIGSCEHTNPIICVLLARFKTGWTKRLMWCVLKKRKPNHLICKHQNKASAPTHRPAEVRSERGYKPACATAFTSSKHFYLSTKRFLMQLLIGSFGVSEPVAIMRVDCNAMTNHREKRLKSLWIKRWIKFRNTQFDHLFQTNCLHPFRWEENFFVNRSG